MPYLLFFAFVVVPLLELYVIIQVGSVIGAWWTIALLVFDSLVGAWLVRREGVRAWRTLTGTFGRSASPVDDLTQGALIVFGGALLLTPGFVTDALGLACVLPLTRAPMASMVRRVGATIAARRMGAGRVSSTTVFMSTGGSGRGGPGTRPPTTASGRVDGQSSRSGTGTTSGTHTDAADAVAPPDVEVLGIERDDD